MVESQVRDRGIVDERILDSMLRVARHKFVPMEVRDCSYQDRPLPILCDQTISQPFIIGNCLELLELSAGQRVLEVGSGCGYVAALLSLLVSEVWGIEYYGPLVDLASKTLIDQGATNVRILQGDGKLGAVDFAPYDRILVSCAARKVESSWLDQLRPGGILVCPLQDGHDQYLYKLGKGLTGWKYESKHTRVRFVPLL